MARLMVIKFTKNKSTTGAMVKSIPSTIVKRTEMLCFTTLVSSSNSSIGCHILITSPPYASATFRIVGTISKIVKFKNPNFRHSELIMLAIIMAGSKIVKCSNAFALSRAVSLVGAVFIIHKFLLSSEIEQLEITVIDVEAQNINATIAVNNLLSLICIPR